MKTHYARIQCGSRRRNSEATEDAGVVTCRACLRAMAALQAIPGPVAWRDGIPIFAVECEGLSASFRCPECGATHTHGTGPDGQSFGHRLSHCECWKPGGYFLRQEAPVKVLPAPIGPAPLLATQLKCSHAD
jgi:hypothetical protein